MLQSDVTLIQSVHSLPLNFIVVSDAGDGHSALASLLVAGMMSLGVTCASI